ncbi:MAG: GLUG motif-containing protein, partial [Ancalomicrobiaceae bacterium]|nr:GLUG motif-containing protein [Ancalomicrobiaceae bacterium]
MTSLLMASTALVGLGDIGAARAQSLPTGGTVVSGTVTINQPTSSNLVITQTSGTAITNWQSFSIGTGNRVDIVQPTTASSMLARVTGATTTTIAGSLTATGQLLLVNPNGIAITPTGTVNVGAGFVATTLGITDSDFLAGRWSFTGTGTSQAVVNAGTITVGPGGYAALIGGTVDNSGTIAVPLGKVALGSGELATLDFSGDGFLQVSVPTQAPGTDALIRMSGKIKTPGGQVEIKAAQAREVARQAINMSGVIAAKSVHGRNGDIVLDGTNGAVEVSGKLTTASRTTKGGTIKVTGRTVALKGATIDASGKLGGGSINIGGPKQGIGTTIAHAEVTTVDAATTINASATETGNGGTVIVWSDLATEFAGSILAKGGTLSGDGGFVETSGHDLGIASTASVSTLAPAGLTGTWLLDPYNVTISTAPSSFITIDTVSSPNTASPFGGSGTVLNVGDLEAALASNNMVVTTNGAGVESGNITVSDAVAWSANTTLTLNADATTGGIFLNASVIATGTNSGLVLNSGVGGIAQTSGTITVGMLSVSTTGTASLADGTNAIATLATSNVGASFSLATSSALTVTGKLSVGGDLTLRSGGLLSVNADVTANAGNAAVILGYGSGTGYALNNGARINLPGTSSTLNIGVSGSEDSYTLVRDVAGLQAISAGSNYALAGDIDATATAGWNGGLGFLPIANYTATFAGLGHVVDGLTINRPGDSTIGLFGLTSGTVRDVTLSNVSISGNGIVSGLVARLSRGTIINAHVTGSVTGNANMIGGLVGWDDQGSITGSSSTAAVTGNSEVGGLVGRLRTGTVTDSYATGSVTNVSDYSGALVGSSFQGGTLTNVYASGRVTGTTNVGGLIGGEMYAGAATATNAYWDIDTTGQSTSFAGTGIATAIARTQSTYSGFDFTNTWVMIDGETRPMLRNEMSSAIATPAALQLAALNPSGAYTVVGNIDFGTAFTADGNGNYAGLWGASGFVPIGDSGTRFTGTFDGQNHTIAGLTINRSATNYVGLFGYTTGASISNVTLAGGSVTGNDDVGPLVGFMSGGTVTNATAGVTAIAVSTGEANVGGLVGANDGGTITSGIATGTVTGAGYQVGGLVGYNFNGGVITLSFATGDVTGTNTFAGNGYIGGLVGANGYSLDGGTITQSYATGTVTGSSGPIGGFVGHNEGTITDAYATGRVIGTGTASNIGGFVGVNYNNGIITNAYSTGYVGGGTQIGGFAGYNNNASSAIT